MCLLLIVIKNPTKLFYLSNSKINFFSHFLHGRNQDCVKIDGALFVISNSSFILISSNPKQLQRISNTIPKAC